MPGTVNVNSIEVRMLRVAICVAIVLLSSGILTAQEIPSPEIYLMSIEQNAGGISFGTPRNISNSPGYDNQPQFSIDNQTVYFSSIRDSVQSDVYGYDIKRDSLFQVTDTPESEFSPTPLPDGKHFSTVRVEMDSSQHLWKMPFGEGETVSLLPNVDNVGYHAWGNEQVLLLFIVAEPHELHVADLESGRANIVINDIGRSLHRIPGQDAWSFMHREEDKWVIKELDITTRRIRSLIAPLEGAEDYTWSTSGNLWMAQGNTLYRWKFNSPLDWQVVHTITQDGVDTINRMAVSSDGKWLAFVAMAEGKKE